MNTEPASVAHLFKAKEARRKQLAKLPFPDKLKALVRLQAMAVPVLRRRGRNVQPWRISGLHE